MPRPCARCYDSEFQWNAKAGMDTDGDNFGNIMSPVSPQRHSRDAFVCVRVPAPSRLRCRVTPRPHLRRPYEETPHTLAVHVFPLCCSKASARPAHCCVCTFAPHLPLTARTRTTHQRSHPRYKSTLRTSYPILFLGVFEYATHKISPQTMGAPSTSSSTGRARAYTHPQLNQQDGPARTSAIFRRPLPIPLPRISCATHRPSSVPSTPTALAPSKRHPLAACMTAAHSIQAEGVEGDQEHERTCVIHICGLRDRTRIPWAHHGTVRTRRQSSTNTG
ncbi:hypothetical protein C8R45DRAFT_249192 [Mycena sanguinolenta]|nr:hypothetical protein C8R45DRAFT_249192 [Mycena sanguinolenta]